MFGRKQKPLSCRTWCIDDSVVGVRRFPAVQSGIIDEILSAEQVTPPDQDGPPISACSSRDENEADGQRKLKVNAMPVIDKNPANRDKELEGVDASLLKLGLAHFAGRKKCRFFNIRLCYWFLAEYTAEHHTVAD